MPPATIPDTDFVESTLVSNGFSQPAFIIQRDGIFYLTKVVWPYDPAMIGDFPDGDARGQAIQHVMNAFAAVPQAAHLAAVFVENASDISQSHAKRRN